MAKNAREPLRTLHENEQTHHIKSGGFDLRVGTGLAQLADTFGKLEADSRLGDSREAHAAVKEILRKLATDFQEHAHHHKTMAESHAASMEACEKGMDDELGKRLVPSNISGIVDPGRAPVASRLVPRAGQREISGAGAVPVVDSQFEH